MLSLAEFYESNRRKNSAELKFGSGWRSSQLEGWECGVFWVVDTKELCALWSPIVGLRSDGAVSRWILGIPPHTRTEELDDDEVSVEILTRIEEGDLEAALEGWADHVTDPDGFEWLTAAIR